MNPVWIGRVAFGELDRPGQRADAAVTAAVHQATDPAKGAAEGDTGREDIGHFPKRQMLEPHVEDAGDRRADESAVKNQPAVADIEYLPKRFAGKILAPIGNHV